MNILEYENYQEKIPHGNPLFPYITYPCSIPLDFSRVPLHWHDEMEIIYIKKGTGAITVDFKSYVVTEGTIALILPGRLHSIEQYMQESMEYENIIFHPGILISKKTDTSNTEFLAPLLSGVLSVPLLYQPGSPCYAPGIFQGVIQEVTQYLRDGFLINDRFNRFFRNIKSQLFMLFYILFSKCLLKEPAKRDHKSLEKMKLILKYLENHYMERITIADISAEVGLSQSHFMKYFKNTMGTSFIEYLNEYRLTMASRLLISSESSILAIAEEVGYENLSYFNRTFKKRFGMTPRDYRKQSTKQL